MRPAKTLLPPEDLLVVAARDSAAAESLACALCRDGLPAVGKDLSDALSDRTTVLLLDTEGHEESSRRFLETLESGAAPPPAVLLTGPDASAFIRVGCSFRFVPQPIRADELSPLLQETREAWRRCAARWSPPREGVGESDLLRIAGLLERWTGTAVRPDRRSAFLRGARVRMAATLSPTPRDYLSLLSSAAGSREAEALAAVMAVGETYFWRYSAQYDALAALLPSLAAESQGTGRVRVWSAGCSTGEEAYSLAIACLEAGGLGERIEGVGTDLRQNVLLTAREGVYGERRMRNLPAPLRRKFFEPVAGGGRVVARLRDAVRFESLNLGGDDLEAWAERNGPFHAVFCRNTLLYMSSAKVERAVGVFERCLPRGGALFLGASETLGSGREGLEVVRAMGSFFYRKRVPVLSGQCEPSPEEASRFPGGAPEPGGDALYEEGLCALEQERFEEAALAFERLAQVAPADVRGQVGLAFILAGQGRDAEASALLQRAEERASPLPEAAYLAGLLAERRGEDRRALDHYAEALDRDPGFFMSHVNRAWILRRLGRAAAFRREVAAALAILDARPNVSSWVTGGLGAGAISGLLAEALKGAEAA